MKKCFNIVLALILAVLLCGCDLAAFDGVVAYRDMQYERPNLAELDVALEEVRQAAEEADIETVLEKINAFYNAYDWFYTCYSLADIRYCSDMTDIYWEEEYDYCMRHSPEADAALEELYSILAQSPSREALEGEEYFGAGFFDDYGDGSGWDPEFLALMEAESELIGEYYDLHGQGAEDISYEAYTDSLAGLLVELIRVRQDIADYWGYKGYTDFAWDFYYYRDYTPKQAERYLAKIARTLVPLYCQVNEAGIWEDSLEPSSEEETYDYLRQAAENMGGTVREAFRLMDKAGLYDIAYGENKYDIDYEVYLTSYWEPFIFLSPDLTSYDKLCFAHEFGHFCNDYASYGSYAGTDVMEVFSQGMEYLSLCYEEDTEALARLKMADSLSLYVEQAAFASFEQQMYELTGEDLTVESLYELYEEVGLTYGLGSLAFDEREFVEIAHLYISPLYIISYVVSNDAAMQLYQMELEEAGTGLACLEENLDTEEQYFLAFLESAGLESPFTAGRLETVKTTFEEILG